MALARFFWNHKDRKDRREDFTSEFICVPLRLPFPSPTPARETTSKISENPNKQFGTSAFGLNSVPSLSVPYRPLPGIFELLAFFAVKIEEGSAT